MKVSFQFQKKKKNKPSLSIRRSPGRNWPSLPEGESDCSSDTFNGVKTTRGTVLFTIIETPFLLFCCCLKAYKTR